jgi:triphosphatase
MPTEVELKLTAPPADLPELRKALAGMAPAAVTSQKRLVSTYYDTQDVALKRRGLTFRVREQDGRFVQTVKSADLAKLGALSRGEWEDPLPDSRPDFDAPESGGQLHLPDPITDDLRPLFVTEVTRTAVDVEPVRGTRIEAAIDEGEIRSAGGDAAEPISEIELELKDGNSAALYDLALRLLEVAPIRIVTDSKSERGYRLIEGAETAPQAVHAEPVALAREMTVDSALQEIGRNCLAQALRNQLPVLERKPEGIHQMRVAVRRLRSAISSLKEMLPAEDRRWVDEELRWLGGALGQARNFDVFSTELLPAARAGMANGAGWDELAGTLDRLRRSASDRAREAVLSERYTGAMLHLLRWFEARGWRESVLPNSSIGDIAGPVLERRRHKLRQRSKGFDRLGPRERHKLRIAAKKLRYTIELLGGLFDKSDLHAYTRKLKGLQDDLGYANDVRVAHDFLPELFAEVDPRGPAAQAWIGVLEWHDQRLAVRERKLRKHLRRLTGATPFWAV